MSSMLNPFSKESLIPQEEMLEIVPDKKQLYIGIPKEISFQEKRICLTPDAVSSLVAHGHKVLIESGAGLLSNFLDQEYSEAGAEITIDTKKVFRCPFILKVEPPTPEEIDMMEQGTLLFSAVQIKTRDKAYFELLMKKRITSLAYEFIKDQDGSYPAVKSLSEIAGTAAVLIASEMMVDSQNGRGLLLGNIPGVAPTEIVIIGAGTVGENAAKAALGLGANVRVFDNSIVKLRRLQDNTNQRVFTSTLQPKTLLKSLMRCDVAIGAAKGKNRAPILVSQTMVEHMKKGAVIVDVSIDSGGCFETSEITTHQNPTFEKYDVIHYCVPNIPSRYSRTASLSLSNILIPFLLQIAESGGIDNTIRLDRGLRSGVYVYKGILSNCSIGQWFDIPNTDIELLVF